MKLGPDHRTRGKALSPEGVEALKKFVRLRGFTRAAAELHTSKLTVESLWSGGNARADVSDRIAAAVLGT